MMRSTLARFLAAQLVLLSVGMAIFGYFSWERLNYFAQRRDDQIITRELARIGSRGDMNAVTASVLYMQAAEWRIIPDIVYLVVPSLKSCVDLRLTIHNCTSVWFGAKNGLHLRPDWERLAAAAEHGQPEELQRRVSFDLPPFYLLGMRVGPEGAVLVGVDRTVSNSQIKSDVLVAVALFGLILLAVVTISVVFVRWMLTSFRSVETTLDAVGKGFISERIPAAIRPSEIGAVATRVNAMLEELETMFTSLRHFTRQIAHELKTPLTRVSTRLANSDADVSVEALRARVLACRVDLEAAQSIFEGLLQIATFEALPKSEREPVDLAHVIREVVEYYEPSAEEKNQSIDTKTERLIVSGHHGLLQRLIGNVLDNAIKYSAPGSNIIVACGKKNGSAYIETADHGSGLTQDERVSFGRLGVRGSANAQPGAGLGLYIVKLISQAHGMSLRLEDNHPGLRVIFEFQTDD